MPSNEQDQKFLVRIIFHAAKWPLFYVIAGLLFIALSYSDDFILPLAKWRNLFNLTDMIGNILIVFGLVTFFYKLIALTCWHYEKKLDNKSVAAIVLSSLRKGLRIISLLIALNIIISLISPSKFYLILSNNIINTIIIGSIGWIAIQILYTFEAVLYQNMIKLKYQESFRGKALYTKMHIIRNVATVAIIVITIAAVLMSFSSVRNIGISLLASAGFLTAIAGLAAQKTLFSLFSGLQIALSQPIKLGDTVVIEDTTGTIEEITFTFVTLKLSDRRRMIFPINYFLEKPFENWSQDISSLRSSISFNIDFMMPLEPLRKELDNILEQSTYWDGTLKKLQVSKLSDRSVEIKIQISAQTADNLSDLRAEVQEKMLEFIQKKFPNYFPKLHLPHFPLIENKMKMQ